MSIFNWILPWRWKRAVHGALDAKFCSTRDALADVLNDVRRQLDARISEQRAEIAKQRAEIAELSEETHVLRQALLNHPYDASLHRVRSASADLERGLAALKNEIAAQLGFSLHDMATQVSDQRLWLERISADLAQLTAPGGGLPNGVGKPESRIRVGAPSDAGDVSRQLAVQQGWLEKISTESTNLLVHCDTSVQSRFNTLENVWLAGILEQIHEIAAVQTRFSADRADRSAWRAYPEERYAPARTKPFHAYQASAEREFPEVYGLWRERLEATREVFGRTKVGNAAHGADLYSRMFRDFVEIHAAGRVLDVGCGIFGRPYYLSRYPAELISGLEPLPMREPADFEVVRGISEYLPWPDGAFSTVLSATSLDHCLSLRRSLDEMTRVLRPGGRILLWIGSIPGARKFAPDSPDFAPADEFHLFHFDKAWFEPLLEERFDLVDRLELRRTGYSHIFYCLLPKPPQPRDAVVRAVQEPAEELI